jgi:hypothetical protein
MRKIACDSCGQIIEGRILQLTVLADARVLTLEQGWDGRMRQVGISRHFCSDLCMTEPTTRHAAEVEAGLDLIETRAKDGDLSHDEAEQQTREILTQLRDLQDG